MNCNSYCQTSTFKLTRVRLFQVYQICLVLRFLKLKHSIIHYSQDWSEIITKTLVVGSEDYHLDDGCTVSNYGYEAFNRNVCMKQRRKWRFNRTKCKHDHI